MSLFSNELLCFGCGLYFCCQKCRCVHEMSAHNLKRNSSCLVTDFRELCHEYGVEEVSVTSKKRLVQQFETLYEADENESADTDSPDKTSVFSTPEQHQECVTPEESPQSDVDTKQKIVYTPHSNAAKLIYSPRGKFRFNYREFVARKAIEKIEDSISVTNHSSPPSNKENVASPKKQVSTSTPTGSLFGEWAAFQEQVAEESISVIIGTLKENLQHNLTHENSNNESSANLSKLKSIIANKHSDISSSFGKGTKKVKFADSTVFTPSKISNFNRVFRKPSRKLTPGPQKRYNNNPKFKALIEAFESKLAPSHTPVTSNAELIAKPARAINFKDDSSKDTKSIDLETTSIEINPNAEIQPNAVATQLPESSNNNIETNTKLSSENQFSAEIKLGTTCKEICRSSTIREVSENNPEGPDNLEACIDELMSIIKQNVKQFIKNPEVAVTLDRKQKLRVIIEVVIDEVKDAAVALPGTPRLKNEAEADQQPIEDCKTPVSRSSKSSDSLDSSGSKRKYENSFNEELNHDRCSGPSKYKKCSHNHKISARPSIHSWKKADIKKSTSY